MKAPELPALTGIRFYLATLVYLSHVTCLPGMETLGTLRVFGLGNVGVSLFFTLSGFILTHNYAAGFERELTVASWGRFIWARLTKIYPMHLLTLLVCIPIQIAGRHRPWDWRAVAAHLSLTQCFIPVPTSLYTDYLNVPSWSISCELFFYLLAPVLIWLCLPGRFARVIGAALLYAAVFAALAFWSPTNNEGILWFSRFAPVRLFEFGAGVIAGSCYYRGLRLTESATRVLRCAGVASLVLAILFLQRAPLCLTAGLLFAPGAVLLIAGLADGHGRLARHLSSHWVVLLGCGSFAFYMIHDPVMRVVKGAMLHWKVSLAQDWIGFGAVVALFVATQFLAVTLFNYFESPAQNHLRRLGKCRPGAAVE